MKKLGIQGVRRGKGYKTTIPDDSAARPADLVQREFIATRPNQLWGPTITAFMAAWSKTSEFAQIPLRAWIQICNWPLNYGPEYSLCPKPDWPLFRWGKGMTAPIFRRLRR